MTTEIVKELIGSYERFNVYKTYFVIKNKDGQVVNTKPRWNETVAKRKKIKLKSLAEQALDALSDEKNKRRK